MIKCRGQRGSGVSASRCANFVNDGCQKRFGDVQRGSPWNRLQEIEDLPFGSLPSSERTYDYADRPMNLVAQFLSDEPCRGIIGEEDGIGQIRHQPQ